MPPLNFLIVQFISHHRHLPPIIILILTSTIIFPLVFFRSRWLAFFSNCWTTFSRVVRYSRANSLTVLQNELILSSLAWCRGNPMYSNNLLYLLTKKILFEYRASDFFSRLVGQSDPWSKKLWVIFWSDGPSADNTVKPVLSGHSEKKTNYCLMQVKSIAEYSKGSILQ